MSVCISEQLETYDKGNNTLRNTEYPSPAVSGPHFMPPEDLDLRRKMSSVLLYKAMKRF